MHTRVLDDCHDKVSNICFSLAKELEPEELDTLIEYIGSIATDLLNYRERRFGPQFD
jgi:hypothetical protein